jgi:hippurate hydrolase
MIGQPAEERIGGARAMLKDGLFTRFPRPDFNLALHADPGLEAGKIGYHRGYIMASVDSVDITIRGTGGHGAYPHLTKDPIVMAAETIMMLQTLVSRETRSLDSAVVTVGSIHGGTKNNIIPDEVKLQLTVRSYKPEVRDHLLTSIERVVKGVAEAAGVPAERGPIVQVNRNEFTPALYNTPDLVERMVPVWQAKFGVDHVVDREPEMGGEDFAEYGLAEPKIPTFLFRLGTIDADRIAAGGQLPGLHSSLYWPTPEPTIQTGVTAMTTAVLELMK